MERTKTVSPSRRQRTELTEALFVAAYLELGPVPRPGNAMQFTSYYNRFSAFIGEARKNDGPIVILTVWGEYQTWIDEQEMKHGKHERDPRTTQP